MKRREAIQVAKSRVGELYRFGDGWAFLSYYAEANGWRESEPRHHSEAWWARSQRLIDICRGLQGLDPVPFVGGSWVNYVPAGCDWLDDDEYVEPEDG